MLNKPQQPYIFSICIKNLYGFLKIIDFRYVYDNNKPNSKHVEYFVEFSYYIKDKKYIYPIIIFTHWIRYSWWLNNTPIFYNNLYNLLPYRLNFHNSFGFSSHLNENGIKDRINIINNAFNTYCGEIGISPEILEQFYFNRKLYDPNNPILQCICNKCFKLKKN